ncbi:MAG: NADH-quinone oxidoreductase subunit J [Anaerolineae bacterium]|nr:NADH-quinone oxidoreductase subunit J [Anaerolineae bacterium]
MTFELVLFIVVAAVAIFSATFMLISRNAVHSALFLVVNLLCVAFFYLMLSAPFLAMVQITVYAGAIMVLFMFVIMLLGAERLGGGTTKYGWLAGGAAALTTVFLVVVFIAVAQGQLGSLQPQPQPPQARFIHAVANAPAVDIYLNEQRVAADLDYGKATDMQTLRAGSYNLLVFAACPEPNCPSPFERGATPLIALPLTLESARATAYIVAGTPDNLRLLNVPLDLSPFAAENTFRLTVVHALPNFGAVNFIQEDLGDPSRNVVLAAQLNFGEASPMLTLNRRNYDFLFENLGNRVIALREYSARSRTHELLILTAAPVPAIAGAPSTRPAYLRPAAPSAAHEFGSPQQIGIELLTTYLLPFQLVGLLLLATMVGAIILTREEVIKRERKRLVVSPAIKRINRAIPINVTASSAEKVLPSGEREPSGD